MISLWWKWWGAFHACQLMTVIAQYSSPHGEGTQCPFAWTVFLLCCSRTYWVMLWYNVVGVSFCHQGHYNTQDACKSGLKWFCCHDDVVQNCAFIFPWGQLLIFKSSLLIFENFAVGTFHRIFLFLRHTSVSPTGNFQCYFPLIESVITFVLVKLWFSKIDHFSI